MGLLGDAGDHVLGAGRSLDVGRDETPSSGFDASAELPGDTGLPHTSLAGQEHMVEIADTALQRLELKLAIEEVVAAHPAAC